MSNKRIAAYMAMASAFAGTCGFRRGEGYKAEYEPVNVRGLSAEEMGTANSRKKSYRQRKKHGRKKNGR